MKLAWKGLLIAWALFALAGPASAGNRSCTINLSPFVGGYLTDVDQHMENRPIFGVRAGYNFDAHWAGEAMFGYSLTQSDRQFGSRETDLFRYGVDILYHFIPQEVVVPFVAVGGGGLSFQTPNTPNLPDQDLAAFNYGVGLKYFLNDNFALRGDLRHVVVFNTETQHNLEYTVGLTFMFGGAKKAAAAPAPVAVYQPPEQEIVLATPETVREAPLAEIPAAEPAPGRNKYCVSLHIEYDIDKADVKPQYHDEVAKVGDFMKKYPSTTAVIEGYTDEVGSDAHNLELSQQRAEGVVKYLEERFGIEPTRLSAKGYGKVAPVADNSSEAGRQKNRRIEAVIDCALDVAEIPPVERLCMTLQIEFDPGRAEIKPQYRDNLAKVGEYLRKYPTTTAIIEGHTDNVGSEESNLRLSRQRAENTVNYLVEKFGIERSRLTAKGYGSSRRIAYNSTPDGRRKNRRINAIIDCVVKP